MILPEDSQRTTDYRDITIRDLALENQLLRERIASLEGDVESSQFIAHKALAAVLNVETQRETYKQMFRIVLAYLRIGLAGRTIHDRDRLRQDLDDVLLDAREHFPEWYAAEQRKGAAA